MSNRPSGILAYGYDLGGRGKGWKLIGASEYGDYDFPWYNIQHQDWENQALNLLLKSIVGFDQVWVHGIEYHKQFKAACDKLRMLIVMYGSFDYPGYILTTDLFKTPDWDSKIVRPFLDHSASEILDVGLAALGIQPTQSQPEWILASFYG